LKVGVQLVSVLTMVEGACQLYVFLADRLSGEPVFRWGSRTYEMELQLTSGLVGAAAIGFGVAGLQSAATCRHGLVRAFHRFQGWWLLWSTLWFALVGMPVEVQHVTVPVVDVWPLSLLPGLPSQEVVDPDWPQGRPSVCVDVAEIKSRLAISLNSGMKNRILHRIMRRLYHVLFRRILTCRQTQRLFWSWFVLLTVYRAYCMSVTLYFLKVVLHGGNGLMIVGDLKDLDKPFSETAGSRALIRRHIRTAFEQMDKDGDGKLSLEELLEYLETTCTRYRGIAAMQSDGRKT